MKLRYCLILFVLTSLFVFSGCAAKSQLMEAASKGEINTVKKLQSERININEKDKNGATALMHAIWSKKPEAAKYLIEAGADVNAKDNYGTPLIYAVDYKQHDVINVLLEKGADIEATDYQGETALVHAALRVVDINSVKILIKAGADINVKSNAYNPPKTLLEALLYELVATDIVGELVNAGASISTPSKGKARLVFFGEEITALNTALVAVENNTLWLQESHQLNLIDVNPGRNKIVVSISHSPDPITSKLRKKTEFSIDTKPDQTYYFRIMQRKIKTAEVLSTALITTITPIIIEGVSGAKPFEISLLENRAAEERIRLIFQTSK